ncbi:hypothetical protein [Intrasporangium flavum]|uniref:hypothetical protein n=1 Tax=Intrasporangium flavum TaxID=1428657 RepID=UPI00096D5F18|nr:hypothetical protein [Intrasporangium flavum]
MSYSIGGITVTDPAGLDAAVTEKVDEMKGNGATYLGEDHTQDSITNAAQAARALIESGALGEGPWTVSLSGHSNPEHKPRAGWSPDQITVSVNQAPRSA